MKNNSKFLFKVLCVFSFLGLCLIPTTSVAQETSEPLNLNKMIQPLSKNNIFRDADYFNWGGSILKGEKGKYHLFYARWKKEYSFAGWLTFSEIAHAVSASPSGPWEYKETVLQGRDLQSVSENNVVRSHSWDAVTAHNPKIKYFEGKYYLYYISTNLGDEPYSLQDLIKANKNSQDAKRAILRKNQRTGVAVSNSLYGPWKRLNAPIIEPSGPIKTLTVNPAIARGKDGSYSLIVKGDKPHATGFVRNQAIAVGKTPIGPFVMQDKAVIDNLDTEDVSMWYDSKRDAFYAVFHAHVFIGLITSNDGLNWHKATNYTITPKKLLLDDNSWIIPDRMERPFVYVENDIPEVLLLAVKKGNDSYTVFVPLSEK